MQRSGGVWVRANACAALHSHDEHTATPFPAMCGSWTHVDAVFCSCLAHQAAANTST